MWKHLIRSRRFQIRCKLFSFDILKKFLTIMIPSTLQQSFISAGKILSPFYFIVSIKLVSDGVLRGSAAMNRFMTATFIDLTIRVVLAFVLSNILRLHGHLAGMACQLGGVHGNLRILLPLGDA